jgi:hypothetical protein
MNRIIIVGNGFDLAHGVKTSYKDFIEWYFGKVVESLRKNFFSYKDDLLEIKTIYNTIDMSIYTNPIDMSTYIDNAKSNLEIIENMDNYDSDDSEFIVEYSDLLERIIKDVENKDWVDIETDYYELLKDYASDKVDVKQLNDALSYIEKKLIEYLKEVESNYYENRIDELQAMIYTPFSFDDISLKGETNIIEHIIKQCEYSQGDILEKKLQGYNVWQSRINEAILKAKEYLNSSKEYSQNSSIHIKDLISTDMLVKDKTYFNELLYPDSIMLLNFNYTKIADNYLNHGFVYEINHIHGKLDDEGSVIFGYGDELDKKYKEIEELNDNEYLEKVKSVKYLERDNYRKMQAFIESEPFQVYVMGHSCGNSDRTLLNTIFEHENCVSIKPFYHAYKDKEGNDRDNYTEIVRNITRNFNDKQLLRERVVNKTYCQPLPQSKIKHG